MYIFVTNNSVIFLADAMQFCSKRFCFIGDEVSYKVKKGTEEFPFVPFLFYVIVTFLNPKE